MNKKYITPSIIVKEIKTVILEGSVHNEKGNGAQLAKDNFINFVGYEESED